MTSRQELLWEKNALLIVWFQTIGYHSRESRLCLCLSIWQQRELNLMEANQKVYVNSS